MWSKERGLRELYKIMITKVSTRTKNTLFLRLIEPQTKMKKHSEYKDNNYPLCKFIYKQNTEHKVMC